MISSTPRSRFLKGFAAALAIPFAVLLLSHAGLEALSRWAESKPGYYLWRHDDSMLLLSQGRFKRPGKGHLMIFGASETGEGFVDNTIERRLPGVSVDNAAFDGATFNDFLVQLEYLESFYGSGSIPSDIVVGISPRFIANIKMTKYRLFKDVVAVYSPGELVVTDSTARVVRKTWRETAASWMRFRLRQTERYRYSLLAAGVECAYRLRPEWARKHDLRNALAKEKFWSRKKDTDKAIRAGLAGLGHWQKAHAWKASDHREDLVAEMTALGNFARRNHTRFYLVNMPLLPLNKDMFAPGVYDDYLKTLDSVRGEVPLLDLSDYLKPNEFSDGIHAGAVGARRISAATADFILRNEPNLQAAQ